MGVEPGNRSRPCESAIDTSLDDIFLKYVRMKAVEFHNACRTGDVSLVKSYLSQGYDVNEIRTKGGRHGYHTACKYGSITLLTYAYRDFYLLLLTQVILKLLSY